MNLQAPLLKGLQTLSMLYDDPVGCPTQFEAVYCFIVGRERVAVTRHRINCLALLIKVTFDYS